VDDNYIEDTNDVVIILIVIFVPLALICRTKLNNRELMTFPKIFVSIL